MSGLDLTLLRPLWLLALPVIAGFGWALWHRQGALGDWSRAADRELLAAMAQMGLTDAAGRQRPLSLVLAAAALTVIALAGPAIERRDAQSFRNLDGVLFVVDASSSVTASPLWPEVLAMGRFGLGALGTRPGGIIVYAGDAYEVTDMTLDHLQLGQTFSLIGPDTVPDPGSRPERALTLASDLLAKAEVMAGDVILFSDGEGLGPASFRAAGEIAAQGARLSVVAATPVPTPDMQTHAAIGGGRVFALSEIEAMRRFLDEDARTRLEQQDFPLLFWADIGRYFLILAMVPVALMFRREGA